MRRLRAIRLFLSIVLREWEPRSCGIPEPYRIHYRLGIRESWRIARSVWEEGDEP